MKYSWWLIILCLLGIQASGFAWNTQGHYIAAGLTYHQLTPKAKQQVELLLAHLKDGASDNFISASAWADRIRANDDSKQYNHWHYIHLPLLPDSKWNKPITRDNVFTKSLELAYTLRDKKGSQADKAWALRMLIHLIADLHQPMHVATLYSQKFPYGDLNGNKYRIKSRYRNLHRYWDLGGGVLAFKKNKSQRRYFLKQVLLKEYPLKNKYLDKKIKPSLKQWLSNTLHVARTIAYQQPMNHKITRNYRSQVKLYTKRQLALAGQHLAQLLNTIFL